MTRAHRAAADAAAASPDRYVYGAGFSPNGDRCLIVSLDVCRRGDDDGQEMPDTNNDFENFKIVSSGIVLGTLLPYDFPASSNVERPYALIQPDPDLDIDALGFPEAHASQLTEPVEERRILVLLNSGEVGGKITGNMIDREYLDIDHVTSAYLVELDQPLLHTNNGARVVTEDTRDPVGMFLNSGNEDTSGIVYPAHLFAAS